MEDDYFTEERVRMLITEYNWELVNVQDIENLYVLRQKDKHYMKTINFALNKDAAERLDISAS